MRTLFLALIVTLATTPASARGKTPPTPVLLSDQAGPDACYTGDPYGPCRGRLLKVLNPSHHRWWYVRVGCGDPALNSVAFIPPRGKALFDLRWGGPGSLLRGQCRILTSSALDRSQVPRVTRRVTKHRRR